MLAIRLRDTQSVIFLHKGFTLLEYVIAMGLFAAILCLCEGLFFQQQKLVRVVMQSLERLDAREAWRLYLQKPLASAGFWGLLSARSSGPLWEPEEAPSYVCLSKPVQIFRPLGSRWDAALPPALQGKVATQTEVLVLTRAGPPYLQIEAITDRGILITQPPPDIPGWYVLSDPQRTMLFWATAYHATTAGYWVSAREPFPVEALSSRGLLSPLRVDAYYLRMRDQALEWMKKSLVPERDASSLLYPVKPWQISEEGKKLKIVIDPDEPPLWFMLLNR